MPDAKVDVMGESAAQLISHGSLKHSPNALPCCQLDRHHLPRGNPDNTPYYTYRSKFASAAFDIAFAGCQADSRKPHRAPEDFEKKIEQLSGVPSFAAATMSFSPSIGRATDFT